MAITTLEQVEEWLTTMVRLQREHNERVHAKWHEQDYPFCRAIWIECAELLDHYGWKWWKHQQADKDQSMLEVVDIWHFGLSELMVKHGDNVIARVKGSLHSSVQSGTPEIPFREATEVVAMNALNRQFKIQPFIQMMQALPMSFNELFAIYLGKNALNLFRQANGYKDGSYRKTWQGREDNEHLVEISRQLDVASPDYMTELSIKLAERYQQVNSKHTSE